MKATGYFRRVVQHKRPYATDEFVQAVLAAPIRKVQQIDGRWRCWGRLADGRIVRVVTEPDGETVHNAFFDRGFRP